MKYSSSINPCVFYNPPSSHALLLHDGVYPSHEQTPFHNPDTLQWHDGEFVSYEESIPHMS